MNLKNCTMCLLFLLLVPLFCVAQTVKNVNFYQEGKTVIITYNLDKSADVSVRVSADGGKTFSTPLTKVTENVGRNVPAGRNRIVWNALDEWEKVIGENFVFQVEAGGKQAYTETAFGIDMKFVWVEGGTFTMGCTSEQGGDCDSDEKTTRRTTLDGYYIGVCEVTQAQWEKVMGTTVYQQRNKADSSWSMYGVGANYPMYYVSWEEATEFCRRLSQKTGKNYCLPTEAQWEYAARGGNKSKGYKYSGSNVLGNVAWYTDNSSRTTHPVATKNANELGIYDMSGNVWEWCSDWWASSYNKSTSINPTGAISGSYRVGRGGSWGGNARSCRVSNRNYGSPTLRYDVLGFRVVALSLPKK